MDQWTWQKYSHFEKPRRSDVEKPKGSASSARLSAPQRLTREREYACQKTENQQHQNGHQDLLRRSEFSGVSDG